MVTCYLGLTGTEAETAVTITQLFSYTAILLAAGVLVFYFIGYLRSMLVAPFEDRWWYLAIGVGAAGVYGVAGMLEIGLNVEAAGPFRIAAPLFFFLFCAIGVRALYATVITREEGPQATKISNRVWLAIIAVFVIGWWGAYLTGLEPIMGAIETLGLLAAVAYALVFSVLTVKNMEGTTIAAVFRQFAPAMVCFGVVGFVEQLHRYMTIDSGIVVAVVTVGVVLTGAFLFTTAIAIGQHGKEMQRKYDRSTWR